MHPVTPDRGIFPDRVGGTESQLDAPDTARAAGRSTPTKKRQADIIREHVRRFPQGLTADQVSIDTGIRIDAVQSRISRLIKDGELERTTERRRTSSGATATVVVARSPIGRPRAADPDAIDAWLAARSAGWGAVELAKYEVRLAELRTAGRGRRGTLARVIAAGLVGLARRGAAVDLVDGQHRLGRALAAARADDPTADTAAEARRAFRSAARPLVEANP